MTQYHGYVGGLIGRARQHIATNGNENDDANLLIDALVECIKGQQIRLDTVERVIKEARRVIEAVLSGRNQQKLNKK